MTRWDSLALDDAELGELPDLPLETVLRHPDEAVRREPTARHLYERWERQQWSADAIELDRDRDEWKRLPRPVREPLTLVLHSFVVGEYTAIDRFPPLLAGAPDEDGLLFLGTQAADEARHTRFMVRLAAELLELPPDLRVLLPEAWRRLTPATRQLHELEAELVNELAERPADYERWLRAVTVFHLATEGVLALYGQRRLVATLRRLSVMRGVVTGFVAMLRDESRHVGFGVDALRNGVRAGHADAISDVVERVAPVLARVDVVPEPTAAETRAAAETARAIRASLDTRLEQIGLPRPRIDALLRRATLEAPTPAQPA